MTALLDTDNILGTDNILVLPIPAPSKPKRALASPAEKATSHLGVMAMAVAATIVIVALLMNVGYVRDDLADAHAQTAAARAATATAQAAADASAAQAITDRAGAAAANNALSAKTAQLVDLRAVALRANSCIEAMFPVMNALVYEQWTTASRLLTNLSTLCSGLGPLLKATGGTV
jgi:hypothetical protein